MKGMGVHNPPSLTIDLSKGSAAKLDGFNGIITEILLSKLKGNLTVIGITNDTRQVPAPGGGWKVRRVPEHPIRLQ